MNKYDSEEILHVKHNTLEYLQFKALNKYNVKHCITLKHGGVSTGELASLNFRTLGTDKIENVLTNLKIISNELNFSEVYKANQQHTDNILILDENNKEEFILKNLNKKQYDGYITNNKNIATLITTADCNPIIIYDPKNNVIANVHAGWKGVINRIYIKAIETMKEKYNSNVEDIIVCVGPSIRKCCFTSQEASFKEKFTTVFNYKEEYLKYEEDNETFHIDLIKILKHEFKNIGIKEENIHVADICTRCNTEDFFSYRETVQNKRNDYATMATIVEIT